MKDRLTFYHPLEEKLNVISHGFGLILSIAALILLMSYAILEGTLWHIFSFGIYGVSLVTLYSASTLYHYVQEPNWRYKLNIFDHSAIYVLIAGSYTPFAIHIFTGAKGWFLFGIIWSLAIIGVTLKLFFTGKYNFVSTIAYVLMGWAAIFVIQPLIENFAWYGVLWIFASGFAYTIGAVLYGLKNVKFNHAIFHVFVLMGSFCHFISVFVYILPHHQI